MLLIEDGAITLTRGDTAYLSLDLTTGEEPYEYQEGDKFTFSVRKDFKDDTPYLFQREVPAGQVIVIYPEDTKNLKYGRYRYDIQLDTTRGEVFTVMGPGVFKVAEEVTL